MVDCEKCKYYHNNCDSKFRCRIDVEKIRADAIDECKEAFNEHLFDSPMINPIMTRNEILLFLDQLKEEQND